MSDRSWFYASAGQQQGPYPEIQFRDFIARGAVTADTLVWTEGMSGWQRAGDIPGLMSRGSGPPAAPQPGVPSGAGGGSLSLDFEILEFAWRSIAFLVGCALILPAPWAFVWYWKWLVPCVHVPGRPNLSFTGTAMTFVPWFFGAVVLGIIVAVTGVHWLNNLMSLVEVALSWLFLKWFVANLASNGQPLGLTFSGSFLGYLGWSILTGISFITIIGWAWVYVAWMRWFCRNLQGTRHEVVFIGSGLGFLWRALVTAIACIFVIPIPWMYRWMGQWLSSQTILVNRGAQADA
jgi:hypothetical protein